MAIDKDKKKKRKKEKERHHHVHHEDRSVEDDHEEDDAMEVKKRSKKKKKRRREGHDGECKTAGEPQSMEQEEEASEGVVEQEVKRKKRKHDDGEGEPSNEQYVEEEEEKKRKKKKKKKRKEMEPVQEEPPCPPPQSSSVPPTGSGSSHSRIGASGGVKRARVDKAWKQAFPNLTEVQWSQLEDLAVLVQEWNSKVNVISRKDIENILPNHVLPCVGLSKLLCSARQGSRLMDVGTGGGFPGLPLAICCPHIQFLLIDSIGKKVRLVQDIADRLGLKNVRTKHGRVEDVREQFDFITGRSVTAMPRFIGWVRDKLKPQPSPDQGGILYIKGGVLDPGGPSEDLGDIKPHKVYALSELIGGDGIYQGDKAILHFPQSLFTKGGAGRKG